MIILIGFIVSIAFFIICFISTANIISSCSIAGITLIYFLLYVYKKIRQKQTKISRFHDCYQFINSFLISLSIKGSLTGALATALESQSEETVELVKSLEAVDPMEKVNYLKSYFTFDVYFLFLDLVNLYNEEGGDILSMSHYLLNQIREGEEYIVNAERLNRNSIVEFSVLWFFSLIILVIIKYSLSDFYVYIVNSNFYQISIVCLLLFTLVTIHIAVNKITSINIKGWEQNEEKS